MVRFAVLCAQVKGGHSDPFLNKWHKAPHISRGLLSRPPSLEQSEFTIARVKLIIKREYWDYYIKHNTYRIVPIISPPRPSCCSFSDLYGLTLRTLPQACFQGWGVFKGDTGRPLNPKCPGPATPLSIFIELEQWVAKRVWVYHWNV